MATDRAPLPGAFTTLRLIPARAREDAASAACSPPLLDLPLPERLRARYKPTPPHKGGSTQLESIENLLAGLQQRVPLIERHFARLVRSLEVLSEAHPEAWRAWTCKADKDGVTGLVDREKLARSLLNAMPAEDGKFHRVRMEISPWDDQLKVIHAPIDPANRDDLLVRMDTRAVRSEDAAAPPDSGIRPDAPFVNKLTLRQHYVEAQRRVGATMGAPAPASASASGPQTPPCFDVVMWAADSEGSGRNLVTESGIANVIVEDTESGRWLTPRVGELGPLPGLLRAELLAADAIEEADLEVGALQDGLRSGKMRLYLCNALRGVFSVTLEMPEG